MALFHRFLLPPLAALLIGLSGCGMIGEEESVTVEKEEPVETVTLDEPSVCEHQWLLESLSLEGREHRSRLLWQKLWRDRPYLTCDALGYVRGSAGSNPYLGRFALSAGGELSWTQEPTISRMSDVRDSSDLEKDYLKALPQTDRMTVKGDSLILKGDGGATRLEFKRAESLEK